MVQTVVRNVLAWGEAARTNYGVDPLIWLIIGAAAAPAFYYSIYRIVRAVSKRSAQEIILWGTVFGFATLAPYLYVMLFGHNLPWWVYAAVVILIGQGAYALGRKIRKQRQHL
jgi:drug/metabolite transporter (DMT)-like permease